MTDEQGDLSKTQQPNGSPASIEADRPLEPLQEVAANECESGEKACGYGLGSAGQMLSKAVYATSYYLSFGIVFPTMLVVGLIPRKNSLVFGLVDGAAAARDAVDKLRIAKAEETSPFPELAGAPA